LSTVTVGITCNMKKISGSAKQFLLFSYGAVLD
jgi:hypothetical protein